MSIEATCPGCSAEFDVRHGECPACTIEINVRSAHAPYHTWPATGHLPFEVHGERFAVTRIPCALDDEQKFRVTHVATGTGLRGSDAATKEEARDIAKAGLAKISREKLHESLAAVAALLRK